MLETIEITQNGMLETVEKINASLSDGEVIHVNGEYSWFNTNESKEELATSIKENIRIVKQHVPDCEIIDAHQMDDVASFTILFPIAQ